MKTFIAILAFASLANAAVRFESAYSAALGGIAIEDACITADSVQSKKPVAQCVKVVPVTRYYGDAPHTEYVCEKSAKSVLKYPRYFTVNQCVEFTGGTADEALECSKSVKAVKFLPATIKVSKITEQGEASNWPGEVQNFTFPACK